jgi:hypothetical protein
MTTVADRRLCALNLLTVGKCFFEPAPNGHFHGLISSAPPKPPKTLWLMVVSLLNQVAAGRVVEGQGDGEKKLSAARLKPTTEIRTAAEILSCPHHRWW